MVRGLLMEFRFLFLTDNRGLAHGLENFSVPKVRCLAEKGELRESSRMRMDAEDATIE
jgi:hypothetical protein